MPGFNIVVESETSNSARTKQLSAMFDVPPSEKTRLSWSGEMPIEDKPWNVGLIVGPSGAGKTTIMREVFGQPKHPKWNAQSVIDDFSKEYSIDDISKVCQSVGFNTIPAWLRPFAVLSNGEKFRVELARTLLETKGTIVVDEFTSVVDRQVAQIGSHAVQKHVRKTDKQFVAVSCHYDIIDWLDPDWIYEPAVNKFQWRYLQQSRPKLDIEISRVRYEAWHLFAPFHYLTAELHKAARCFGLYVNGRLAAFAGMLHRPHPKVRDIMGCSRLVTLPDWQGLGLAMILIETLGRAYKGVGKRVHTYPAHPSLIRSFDKAGEWKIEKRPGSMVKFTGAKGIGWTCSVGKATSRPCAVFSFAGDAMPSKDAMQLINGQ